MPTTHQAIRPVSIDLLRAWQRSDKKIPEWTLENAAMAADRYERFLLLVAARPGQPYAPTRDIDEMWHLHMLSPKAYYDDCVRVFGEVLDHDGGFGKEAEEEVVLKEVFETTAKLWQEHYGEPYVTDRTDAMTNCWHDCVGRCWHACSKK
uniref:glycine-rich domain-containing protein n=1 Tax=Cupriavidus necator TaxID=106590 RepID=UPI003F494439